MDLSRYLIYTYPWQILKLGDSHSTYMPSHADHRWILKSKAKIESPNSWFYSQSKASKANKTSCKFMFEASQSQLITGVQDSLEKKYLVFRQSFPSSFEAGSGLIEKSKY